MPKQKKKEQPKPKAKKTEVEKVKKTSTVREEGRVTLVEQDAIQTGIACIERLHGDGRQAGASAERPYSDRGYAFWDRDVSYARQKTGSLAMIHFGPEIESILHRMCVTGPLFPYLQSIRSGDRATEFKQHCEGLGIKGVSLHSYRYAWAERAKQCG